MENQSIASALLTASSVLYVVAAVAAAVAVFLWFKLKIPSVIGDLSGRTARKSIAKTRAHNEKTGNKSFKSSATNVNRGMLTGTMPGVDKKRGAAKKPERRQAAAADNPETGLLRESADQEMTGLLNGADTAPLEEGTVLLHDPDVTAPLLNQTHAPVKRSGGKKIELLEEVLLIHTEEQIV